MFFMVTGLIGLYVILRFVPALPWPVAGKCLAALVVLLISQLYLINRMFLGNIASPEIPGGAVIVLGWLIGALILLAIFLLLKDVTTLLLFALNKAGAHLALPFSAGRVNIVLAAAALILAAIGVWQAERVPDVRETEITLDRLPAELDGLRVVQLTDLHASRFHEAPWIRAVVERANALNPDLTLITGDIIDGSPARRAADVAPLAELKARLGVLAIPGNHEYYSDYTAWMAAFGKLGLRMLNNRHVVIRDRGQTLVVAGTTDRNAERFGMPTPDIQAALAGAPKNATVILMAHQPRDAVKNAAAGVDLQFSGHTHGGQIVGLHLIVQRANEGFVSGAYRVGAMWLYVSNGAGLWSGFPIRLGRSSEITLVTLRSRKS